MQPTAPAASAAPTQISVGPEQGPVVSPAPPKVEIPQAQTVANNALATEMTTPPVTVENASEKLDTLAANTSPGGNQENTTSQNSPTSDVSPEGTPNNHATPTSAERQALQQKAYTEITGMNLGIDLATATPTEIMDALKARGWQIGQGDAKTQQETFDYAMAGRDEAIAQRKIEARQKIQEKLQAKGITLTAETNIDNLMAELTDPHSIDPWKNDEATKAYVQGALDLVQAEAGVQQQTDGQTDQENTAANAQPAASEHRQASEAAVQQTLAELGLRDTRTNREIARQIIVAKEQVTAALTPEEQAAEDMKMEKERSLSSDERAIMKTFTDMMIKESGNFSNFYAALMKDDPVYAKELAENLKIYKEMVDRENASKQKRKNVGIGLLLAMVYFLRSAASSVFSDR